MEYNLMGRKEGRKEKNKLLWSDHYSILLPYKLNEQNHVLARNNFLFDKIYLSNFRWIVIEDIGAILSFCKDKFLFVNDIISAVQQKTTFLFVLLFYR